jgi:hypothetical protein
LSNILNIINVGKSYSNLPWTNRHSRLVRE